MNETFSELGFDEREVAIYTALLQLGHGSIRDIAAKANLNRGSTYESLKTLQQKGIVSYFPKGKRRFFCAEPPEKLLVLAKEKKQRLEETIQQLSREIIPDLNQLQPAFNTANVHYYEGDDGIEHVLRDILNTVAVSEPREYCVYSSRPIRKYLYRPFPNYTRQRIQRNIRVKVIAVGEGGEDAALSERKWISTDGRRIASSYIAIYPPKCAMFSLVHEDYPTAVVIDAQEIALAHQLVFETLLKLL
jgi:sugar-specific transcriptional regulator TrmB